MAPVTSVPVIPWDSLVSQLAADWQPGDHVTIVGPTGSGKTHIALTLAEMTQYVLVLATKRRDPLVSELAAHGYHVTGDTSSIQWTAGPDHAPQPVHNRVVFWPRFGEKTAERDRLKMQAEAMRKVLAWADQTGEWTVIADETMWMTKNLRLEKELEALWFQGRTQHVSLIANAQRPSQIPRLAYSSATYLFLGQTADGRDVENLREISGGFPPKLIEAGVTQLDRMKHEFLFVDTRRTELARVVAPPR
jgi:hypothetical protein